MPSTAAPSSVVGRRGGSAASSPAAPQTRRVANFSAAPGRSRCRPSRLITHTTSSRPPPGERFTSAVVRYVSAAWPRSWLVAAEGGLLAAQLELSAGVGQPGGQDRVEPAAVAGFDADQLLERRRRLDEPAHQVGVDALLAGGQGELAQRLGAGHHLQGGHRVAVGRGAQHAAGQDLVHADRAGQRHRPCRAARHGRDQRADPPRQRAADVGDAPLQSRIAAGAAGGRSSRFGRGIAFHGAGLV